MTLDNNTLGELKERLLEDKSRLEEELKRIGTRVGKTDDYEPSFDNIGTDEDENATEVETYTDNLAINDSLEKQLKNIDEALKRMEKGTYGYCDNCKKEIDLERLRAYPAATTCINCN